MIKNIVKGGRMNKTVGLIFSGYGEQYITMGKDIYNQIRDVQDLFDEASLCLDTNFVQLCFASSDNEISSVEKGYVAILLFQISVFNQLLAHGLRPDFIAGFGIGEYAAAVGSGSLSFVDGLYLLQKYAKLYNNFLDIHQEYGVVQITKDIDQKSLEALCQKLSIDEKKIWISAIIGPESFYVAGHKDQLELLKKYCIAHEIRKVKTLSARYGLQSLDVESVVTGLSPYLFKIDFKPLKFPVITNTDGVYVTSPDGLESSLLRQITTQILWNEVMDGFIGCQNLICVGPGEQIFAWAKARYPEKNIYHVENFVDLEKIISFLEKLSSPMQILSEDFDELKLLVNDYEPVAVPDDLTIADQINELPTDYDFDEE